ncbi:hypothetical protein Leryth_015394 [Lithospermum erythrorhizon]|nr:hypothetical protein Leryth_015394 [Lithospermum erythrorhizon]
MSLSELVNALPIPKEKVNCVYSLMRLLIQSGFFLEILEGCVFAPAAHLFLKDNPFCLTPVILSMLDPVLTEPWHHLSNWLGIEPPTTPFESFHGKAMYEFASREPKFNPTFNEAMSCDARLLSSVVLRDCKDVFKGVDVLVDIGGGTGAMAKAIADAFPDISCMVLELPHVVDGLQGSSNLSFVAGDMFDSVPPADAILLKWILHNWDDDKCVEIIKNCREALLSKGGKGKVIILDMAIDTKRENTDVETLLLVLV